MTVLSKCRAPGLSNDSSMSSLTTASLSNRSGERKRGFHIRTVETLSASTAPGGGIKCIPTCLRGQYATASPLKIKKEKTPIADQLWVFESRNGAAAKALAVHGFRIRGDICTELVGSFLRSGRFFFQSLGFSRFMEQSGVIIIIEILNACTGKRKIFIIIVVLLIVLF